jgi:hypothetical protein
MTAKINSEIDATVMKNEDAKRDDRTKSKGVNRVLAVLRHGTITTAALSIDSILSLVPTVHHCKLER